MPKRSPHHYNANVPLDVDFLYGLPDKANELQSNMVPADLFVLLCVGVRIEPDN